jgi:HTH-type transcriptional regulator/antitoxin HigA
MFGADTRERFDKAAAAWLMLQESAPVAPIRGEKHHAQMLELLEWLRGEVGDRHSHKLAGLLQIVMELIEDYEAERFPIADAEPREVLRMLMEQHGLRQGDLAAELGSQSVVSEILRGKREINTRQARALAKRFNLAVTAFI